MRRYLAAWLVLLAGAVSAQEAPVGLPQTEKSPRDAEFGVVTRRFGLERRVEMYQWRVAGQGYEKVWSATPIASAAFAPGHDNPPTLPLAGRRVLADAITLDGRPLDPEVVARLGEWREFRPNFSALPGNLSATFQPEGDGLGSAENPLDPQIGDLRVTWRELTLPSLDGKVALQDGIWKLQPHAADAQPAAQAGMPASSVSKGVLGWLIGAGIFALVILVIVSVIRNRRR
ncbi:TMEM43 family protein [Luteimonas sp. SX5]|uniref:TMEM43 family protein n=1 Tax=Luteimonas galliterrae TaxID=2940486 RepID=A0ABT0MFN1_9GAMM|nr:TMEM43 family protein [Luteimonas galliterrae]MCL1633079.1 TMEM43 family protein [Luteimonas galliterrae]